MSGKQLSLATTLNINREKSGLAFDMIFFRVVRQDTFFNMAKEEKNLYSTFRDKSLFQNLIKSFTKSENCHLGVCFYPKDLCIFVFKVSVCSLRNYELSGQSFANEVVVTIPLQKT